MTNIDTTDSMQINGTEIEKGTNYKYLVQTIVMENRTKPKKSFDKNKSMLEWFFFVFVFFWKVQKYRSGEAPSHESKKKNV